MVYIITNLIQKQLNDNFNFKFELNSFDQRIFLDNLKLL